MNFCLSYRPGSKNGKPDVFSWRFAESDHSTVPNTILPPLWPLGAASWNTERSVLTAQSGEPVPSACPLTVCLLTGSSVGPSFKLACHPGVRHTAALLSSLAPMSVYLQVIFRPDEWPDRAGQPADGDGSARPDVSRPELLESPAAVG